MGGSGTPHSPGSVTYIVIISLHLRAGELRGNENQIGTHFQTSGVGQTSSWASVPHIVVTAAWQREFRHQCDEPLGKGARAAS